MSDELEDRSGDGADTSEVQSPERDEYPTEVFSAVHESSSEENQATEAVRSDHDAADEWEQAFRNAGSDAESPATSLPRRTPGARLANRRSGAIPFAADSVAQPWRSAASGGSQSPSEDRDTVSDWFGTAADHEDDSTMVIPRITDDTEPREGADSYAETHSESDEDYSDVDEAGAEDIGQAGDDVPEQDAESAVDAKSVEGAGRSVSDEHAAERTELIPVYRDDEQQAGAEHQVEVDTEGGIDTEGDTDIEGAADRADAVEEIDDRSDGPSGGEEARTAPPPGTGSTTSGDESDRRALAAAGTASAALSGRPVGEKPEARDESRSQESGSQEAASQESGSREPGARESRSEESQSWEPGSQESASQESASQESGSRESASQESASREARSQEARSQEAGSQEARSEESQSEEPQSEEPQSEEAQAQAESQPLPVRRPRGSGGQPPEATGETTEVIKAYRDDEAPGQETRPIDRRQLSAKLAENPARGRGPAPKAARREGKAAPSTSKPAASSNNVKRWLLVIALLLLAAVAAAVAVFFQGKADAAALADPSNNMALVDTAGTAALNAQTREAVEAIFSYDTAQLAASEKRGRSYIAPGSSYLGKFQETYSRIRGFAAKGRAILQSTVAESGVERLNDNGGKLLLMVNQVGRSGVNGPPIKVAVRLSVTTEKVGGIWKVSEVETD